MRLQDFKVFFSVRISNFYVLLTQLDRAKCNLVEERELLEK